MFRVYRNILDYKSKHSSSNLDSSFILFNRISFIKLNQSTKFTVIIKNKKLLINKF